MKDTLILVTPVLRTNNLIYIAHNIVKRFKDEIDLQLLWILCFDKYHADISPLPVKKLEVYCLENNLPYLIYYQGENCDANYGGALMNKPLEDVKNKLFKDSNPLVYVLDDDNILHPEFLSYIKSNCIENENVHWLNMLDEFGAQRFVRTADRLAYVPGTGVNSGYRIIHRCATCDPSQVIMRLNTILSLGGFASTRDYDFKFMNQIYANDSNIDNNLQCQGDSTWIPNNEFYISSYHNGLVTKEMIETAINDLNSETFSENKKDSYIRIHTKNCNFNLELSLEDVLKILKEKENEISE